MEKHQQNCGKRVLSFSILVCLWRLNIQIWIIIGKDRNFYDSNSLRSFIWQCHRLCLIGFAYHYKWVDHNTTIHESVFRILFSIFSFVSFFFRMSVQIDSFDTVFNFRFIFGVHEKKNSSLTALWARITYESCVNACVFVVHYSCLSCLFFMCPTSLVIPFHRSSVECTK